MVTENTVHKTRMVIELLRENTLKTVNRQVLSLWTLLAKVTHIAQLRDIIPPHIEQALGLKLLIEELQILTLSNTGNLVTILQFKELVEPTIPLTGITAATHPDGVIRMIRTTSTPWYHMLNSEVTLLTTIDTLLRVLLLMYPLPYGCTPLYLPRLKPLIAVHDEAIIGFPEPRGLRDYLGVLPVQQVLKGLHSFRRHT
jgi:hypothetical protein